MKSIKLDAVTYQMLTELAKKSSKHKSIDDFICSLIADTYNGGKKR